MQTTPVIPSKGPSPDSLRAVVDAGIALAFHHLGTGIAAQWAAKLKPHVHIIADPAQMPGGCQTACVTVGGVFFFEPFLKGLTAAEVVFLVAHETCHIALAHLDQAVHLGVAAYEPQPDGTPGTAIVQLPGKEHESKLLGIAQDVFINETLTSCTLGKMIHGGLSKTTLAQQGGEPYPDTEPFTSEAMYYWLLARVKPEQGYGGGGSGNAPAMGGCTPQGLPGGMGKLETEQMRAAIRESALASGGKAPGKGSALAEAFAPVRARIDWRSILKNAFETASEDAADRSERSFARASRRQSDDIIQPGLIGTMARLAVIVDVSGSVGPEWASKAASYIARLQEDFPEVSVWLGTHTHETVWQGWLKPGTDREGLKAALSYTGGTDATQTFEDCDEASKTLGGFDVLIHFTDCELPSWPKPPAKRFIVGVLASSVTPKIPHPARVIHVTP